MVFARNFFWMSNIVCVHSSRQGGLLVNFHPSILSCLLPQLTSPRLAVRKRTIIALGHLVMSCGNLVFVDLIEHLLSELSRNESMSTTRTYIQCIAAISRQAGHRIGEAPPLLQTSVNLMSSGFKTSSQLLFKCRKQFYCALIEAINCDLLIELLVSPLML